MEVLSIENLKMAYAKNDFILDIAKLSIDQGQIVGIVGNNGAGKSSFFKLILDLVKPVSGSVKILGWNVVESEEWKRHTGSFLDESYLIEFLTAEEYFDFIGFLNDMREHQFLSGNELFAELFGNEIMSKKKLISSFSTGNKQKIGVAAALLSKPKFVLLDEPFSNLDPGAQVSLKKIIKFYNQEYGTTFLISSHNLQHIVDISDRTLIFKNGNIIRDILSADISLKDLENYF